MTRFRSKKYPYLAKHSREMISIRVFILETELGTDESNGEWKRAVLLRSTRIRYNERVRSPRFKRRDASSISLSAVNHNSCDATRFFIFKSLRKRIAPTNIIIRAFRAIGVEKMRQYPFNIDIPSNCFVKPRSVIFHKKNPPVDRDDHARARARDISFPVLF